MSPFSRKDLLEAGFQQLGEVLAQGLGLKLRRDLETRQDRDHDAWWQVSGGDGRAVRSILVEAKGRVTPRALEQPKIFFTPARLRQMGDPIILIVAPWLSPRSQAAIADMGWSYVDLTGNILLRAHSPALYVRLAGATTDPQPRLRGEVLLRGARINALVRLLVDVVPPYRLADLAKASGLSQGYVSRALTALHEQGLIDRPSQGPVTNVKWADLLRHRANEYDLIRSNNGQAFLVRSGAQALLKELDGASDVTVTGSFAAYRVNPVAAPAQLALYVSDVASFVRLHGLLPTESGANVLLLSPASPSQLDRPRIVDGLRHAGYSQLVQDLLAGNGRLPEEGEAIIEWMDETADWRVPTLRDAIR